MDSFFGFPVHVSTALPPNAVLVLDDQARRLLDGFAAQVRLEDLRALALECLDRSGLRADPEFSGLTFGTSRNPVADF